MNTHPFSSLDGLKVAAEMERRGGAYYERAVRIVQDAALKKLLLDLAEEERVHLAEFQRLYEEARQAGRVILYGAETSAYLSALAADYVFPGGLAELVGEQSPQAILRASIHSEEESIAFYEEMARVAPDEEARDCFAAIADVERGHRIRLQERLQQAEKE